MYIIVYISRYTWHCTYDKVRRIKQIMHMLYSSHLIIFTMSGIPTGIYNNVHALFFSPYSEKNKACKL
jgi:hypothetical protein